MRRAQNPALNKIGDENMKYEVSLGKWGLFPAFLVIEDEGKGFLKISYEVKTSTGVLKNQKNLGRIKASEMKRIGRSV